MLMTSRPRARGFTLIEILITIVVVGILAGLAVVGFSRYIRASHTEEAQDIVIHIRAAEEAFYAENGAYLDVSGCVGTGCSYPSKNPGAFATTWGAQCTWCKNPNVGWSGLAYQPSKPVYFGYSVIADAATGPLGRGLGTQAVNGQPLNLTNLGANGAPWYFIEADANITGDGTSFTHVYGMSGMTQLFVEGSGN
jgi:type IV pilus assembly protein PilA